MAKYVTFPLNNTNYRAEDMQLWHSTRGNGVFSAADELITTFKSGMAVTISAGRAWIGFEKLKGIIFGNMSSVDLAVDMADGLLDRKDYVVIKYDIIQNETYLYIKKGTESSVPQPPTLARDINVAYELAIAEINVIHGIVELNQGLIADKRLDEDLCGIMRDGVTSIPTEILQAQWEGWFNEIVTNSTEDWNNWYNAITTKGTNDWNNWYNTNTVLFGKQFTDWFENVKGVLNDDVAGNLLNLINLHSQQFKTYAELKTLKDNSSLIPAAQYVLIDYKTKYKQPTTNIIKEVGGERLILTANSPNTFEPIVSSIEFPHDIIHYVFDDNLCEDGATPRKGFIKRRKDIVNNIDIPQDWRHMLWTRYVPDENQYYYDGNLVDYNIWTSGNAKTNVLYKADNKLWLAKNTNVPSNLTDTNTFDEYCDLNYAFMIEDKLRIADKIELKKGNFQEKLSFTDIGNTNYNIYAGDTEELQNNVFDVGCHDTNFDIGCHSNTFISACNRNTFASYCSNNTFASSCYSNTFASSCFDNAFANHCFGNTFASSCSNNTFASHCSNNIFASYCYSNTFASYCYKNNIKYLINKDLTNITFLQNTDHTINFEKNSKGDLVYWYLDSNNTPVYTLIP